MAAQLGTFDDLLALAPEPLRPVVEALRAAAFAACPEANETVRLGDRAASYGLGPRKMLDGYAYVMPHARWVNLGFYQGAALPDPEGLLEGTGARLRHVKVRSAEEARRPALRALLDAAVAERASRRGLEARDTNEERERR